MRFDPEFIDFCLNFKAVILESLLSCYSTLLMATALGQRPLVAVKLLQLVMMHLKSNTFLFPPENLKYCLHFSENSLKSLNCIKVDLTC